MKKLILLIVLTANASQAFECFKPMFEHNGYCVASLDVTKDGLNECIDDTLANDDTGKVTEPEAKEECKRFFVAEGLNLPKGE